MSPDKLLIITKLHAIGPPNPRVLHPQIQQISIRRWLNPQMQSPWIWKTDCTMPFYIRASTDFGNHGGSWNQSRVYQGRTVDSYLEVNTHEIVCSVLGLRGSASAQRFITKKVLYFLICMTAFIYFINLWFQNLLIRTLSILKFLRKKH